MVTSGGMIIKKNKAKKRGAATRAKRKGYAHRILHNMLTKGEDAMRVMNTVVPPGTT